MRGGGNTSSNSFKVKKEDLPGWAVNWARGRFNMDAQNVKFYVMDTEDSDEQFAMASGDSIFMASGNGNDEELIKHELTHIYQQAIGTATESNADDTSLEEEAINVSKESENIPVKGQAQRDKYIIPKERTNVVQYRRNAARDIAKTVGLAVGGILTLGILPLGMWLAKQIKYKRIANKYSLSFKDVKKISNSFSFAKEENNVVDKILSERKRRKSSITIDDITSDGKVFQRSDNPNWGNMFDMHRCFLDYREMFRFGFKGFNNEGARLKKFGIDLSLEDNILCYKLDEFMCLYILTKGFTERTAGEVTKDYKNITGTDLSIYNRGFNPGGYKLRYFKEIYRNAHGFSKVSSGYIGSLSQRLFGRLSFQDGMSDLMELFDKAGCEDQKDLDELINNIFKIADVLDMRKEGKELNNLLNGLNYYKLRENSIYLSALRSGEIIPIIEEVAETDKYKKKGYRNSSLTLEDLLEDCVKKIDSNS